ncbi:MAG: dipeptidase [Acidobacteria bacterium]|nr:dipeptidase [Acidobacteriota bacterium]
MSKISPEAAQLHNQSIIIDGLNISRWSDEEVYRHLREGGITAINASVAVWEGTKATLQNIGRFYRDFETYGQYIRPVTTVADIHAAKKEGKTGVILGFQNSSPIEEDLDLVEVFYKLGVRVIQITYNDLNFVGAGCYERQDIGLSQFGMDLVREMDRLGMIVDLSHVGYKTTMDAIEASRNPVWFSHANPMALKKHVRNKTDEQVQALVKKGGVVGVNIFPPFLQREYEATLDDVIDVFEYWLKIAGEDHVSVGLDFTENQSEEWFHWLMSGKRKDPVYPLELPLRLPQGITRADEMPNLTEGLLKRGLSENVVRKIMGENVLRLLQQVWGA